MNRLLSVVFVALITGALVSCAAAPMGPITIKTSYLPSREPIGVLPPCASVSQITVTDSRTDPSVIGQRYSEDRPQERFPVKSDDSVVSAVKTGIESSFKRANLALKPGRPELKVALTTVDLDEKVFRQAEFVGRVVVDLSLVQPGSAKPCWTGSFQGRGTNYGRAGSIENYNETIARALDELVNSIAKDPGFREVVCGACGGTTPNAQSEFRRGSQG